MSRFSGAALGLTLLAGMFWTGAATAADLSGTWSVPFQVHSSGLPMWSGVTPWLPASQGDPHQFPIPSLKQMNDRVDESVRTHNGNPTFAFPKPLPPPLTAAGRAAAAKIDTALENRRELNCYPSNVFARVGGGTQTVQIVQGRDAVAIISDGHEPGRIIYVDGRKRDDLPPQWNGVSSGHWDGDALQVVTIKIRGETLQAGYPISEHARLLETYRLINDGKRLEVDATFEDPTYYTEALRQVMYLDPHPELRVTDYSCEEGKEDMIETAQKTTQKGGGNGHE
jgi:hypothetical protein